MRYEYAYLSLARYFFAARYGTAMEQMRHLHRALGESTADPEHDSFLGEEADSVRRTLFQLQARTGYLREALDTLSLMRQKGDMEGSAAFESTRENILELRASDEAYAVAGLLDDGGSWNIILLKDGFYLDEVTGHVAQLKLRCERDYVFFEFDRQMQYTVSDGAGECGLQVIGDPDTTFTLVQR